MDAGVVTTAPAGRARPAWGRTDVVDEQDQWHDDAGDDAATEIARTRTGDDAVDAALTRLADLSDRPVREHVAVFENVHGELADRLAESRD